MIALLNLVPFLIAVVTLLVIYKVKGLNSKCITGVLGVVVFALYMQLQPSYMPKGTVKSIPIAEFKVIDKPMEDRMRKPVAASERDAKIAEEFAKSDARREAFLKNLNENKQ